MTDVGQIDPNLAKIHQTMREMNLKYTVVPNTRIVLVRYCVDNQESFTLVIEIHEKLVTLKMPLTRSSDIGGLIRAELSKRLLAGNDKIAVARFGLDQYGNVGVRCDLSIEDFTAASLGRQLKAITTSMLYFVNEIARPLGMKCGDSAVPTVQPRTVAAPIKRTQTDSFEIEVYDVTHGSSTKLMITMHTTVREISLEAIRRLGLQAGDYLLVHNGRKLGPERANNTADSLAIARGDSLDIMLANDGMQLGNQSRFGLLTRFAKHQTS